MHFELVLPPPLLSCLNLNFVRCSVGNPGQIGIDGVFRDHKSGVVRGFPNAYLVLAL